MYYKFADPNSDSDVLDADDIPPNNLTIVTNYDLTHQDRFVKDLFFSYWNGFLEASYTYISS